MNTKQVTIKIHIPEGCTDTDVVSFITEKLESDNEYGIELSYVEAVRNEHKELAFEDKYLFEDILNSPFTTSVFSSEIGKRCYFLPYWYYIDNELNQIFPVSITNNGDKVLMSAINKILNLNSEEQIKEMTDTRNFNKELISLIKKYNLNK